ncbi:gamma-glutamyl-gamma-aminobutyrate hydrolase family protein [Limnochorda pilosa]|uniref:Peptidase C26 n=1 Tax=Limnochorda pilosa TaxID=1555112 RepID=A0A0K2SNJ2_LIMPI|nr:gamma-glutamyl-gamma-aminobutyrate hydrolase family protein [Limnochorda pilosa]BAS28670.1 peptidase C26 [Limnochorda pilosa]
MEQPVIGITCGRTEDQARVFLNVPYLEAVVDAGGLPVALAPVTAGDPPEETARRAGALLARVDGLLLSGGDDVDPALFGEEPDPRLGWVDPDRDGLEVALARAALQEGRPILAICRGIQVLNVAAGGDVYQDLAQHPGALQHRQQAPRWHASHAITVRPGSVLARVLGLEGGGSLRVNSFHHQAVRRVAPGFRAVAEAADGLVEAIEADGSAAFCLGVQWHPEHMVKRWPAQRGLFRALVEAARTSRRLAVAR